MFLKPSMTRGSEFFIFGRVYAGSEGASLVKTTLIFTWGFADFLGMWVSFVFRLVYGAAMGPEQNLGGCPAGGVAKPRKFFPCPV